MSSLDSVQSTVKRKELKGISIKTEKKSDAIR